MKRSNKVFVKSMIITSVVGLSVLMISLFVGIKYFTNQGNAHLSIQPESIVKSNSPNVEYSSTILGLVQQISEEKIIAFDIEKKQVFDRDIAVTTKINDSYGSAIPLSSIKKGDIVEIIYQPEKETILFINKTARAWQKQNVSGLKINTSDKQIVIGNKTYAFTKDILVLTEEETESSPYFIQEYDIVNLQGEKDNIWSIEIVERAATLELKDVPTVEGMLEIDRTRMIPLKDITEPISLQSGKHNIVIDMQGYEPVTQEIDIASGEKFVLNLQDAKKAFTNFNLIVTNADVDYTVAIDGKSFKKGEAISVEQGKYTVHITAEGYKIWEKELEFTQESHELRVNLEKEQTDQTLPPNQTIDDVNSSNTQHTITIETDPTEASVYIGDIYKGKTPLKVTLPLGDYSVRLSKGGYEDYTAHIVLDHNSTQSSFLYVLAPNR